MKAYLINLAKDVERREFKARQLAEFGLDSDALFRIANGVMCSTRDDDESRSL